MVKSLCIKYVGAHKMEMRLNPPKLRVWTVWIRRQMRAQSWETDESETLRGLPGRFLHLNVCYISSEYKVLVLFQVVVLGVGGQLQLNIYSLSLQSKLRCICLNVKQTFKHFVDLKHLKCPTFKFKIHFKGDCWGQNAPHCKTSWVPSCSAQIRLNENQSLR